MFGEIRKDRVKNIDEAWEIIIYEFIRAKFVEDLMRLFLLIRFFTVYICISIKDLFTRFFCCLLWEITMLEPSLFSMIFYLKSAFIFLPIDYSRGTSPFAWLMKPKLLKLLLFFFLSRILKPGKFNLYAK